MSDAERLAFTARVLAVFDRYDQHESLFWRTGEKYGGGVYDTPAQFFARCSDLFYWGCADLEEITPGNVAVLEGAMADAKAADQVVGACHGGELFCCRVRGMRPQGAAYPPEVELWPLFDACGPERPCDGGNPRPHPGTKAKE